MNAQPRGASAHAAPLFVTILVPAALKAAGVSFPFAYALGVVAGVIALISCRSLLKEYPPRWVRGMSALGVALGALWYVVEKHFEYPHLGADNSAVMVRLWLESEPHWRPILWFARVVGFLLVTPIAEELFFRAFLPRYLAGQGWDKKSFREVSWLPYLASAIAFAALHREWLPAIVFALLMNEAIKRSQTPWACILAHSAANVVLACWHLW